MGHRTIKALDVRLNVAINHIATKLFPSGFDVAPSAPPTFAGLRAHVEKTGRILVWSGASHATIYDDAETNYAFRAWHDFHHWRQGLDFAPESNERVAEEQCADLMLLYGDTETTRRWCKIIRAEIIGQQAYFDRYGEYPRNQRAFVMAYLKCPRTALTMIC